MTFEEFLGRIPSIRMGNMAGRAGRKSPYKPLLLGAIVQLVRDGEIPTPDVYLDGALTSVYTQLLRSLFPGWSFSTDPRQPFRHLQRDGLLALVAPQGLQQRLQTLLDVDANWRAIADLAACGRLPEAVHVALATDAKARQRVLKALDKLLERTGASGSLIDLIERAPYVFDQRDANILVRERLIEETLVRGWRRSRFARHGIELYTNAFGEKVGQQFHTGVGIIDLLGWQEDERRWWVIELKKGRPDDKVVGQVSRYIGWVGSRMGRKGDQIQGAVVAPAISRKLRYAARAHQGRISLWQVDADCEVAPVEA